ncbi:uncharacterized protein LOC141905356 [Tubulanus polymorphus]|uniref:uncharacterized protein LOC141905356 n=1 Tax=Tubulanus polymorphus TaxID=672921 RepID=UPI003DA4D433
MEDNTNSGGDGPPTSSVQNVYSIDEESSYVTDDVSLDVSPEELAAQLENDDQEKRYRDWRKIGKSIFKQQHALMAMAAFLNEDYLSDEVQQQVTKQLGPQVTPGEPAYDDDDDDGDGESKGKLDYRSHLRKTNFDPEAAKSPTNEISQIDFRSILKPSPSRELLNL